MRARFEVCQKAKKLRQTLLRGRVVVRYFEAFSVLKTSSSIFLASPNNIRLFSL